MEQAENRRQEDQRKSILRRANSVGDNKKEVRFAEQLEKSIEINKAIKRKPRRSLSQPLMNFRPSVESMKDFVKSFVDGSNREASDGNGPLVGGYKNLLFFEADPDEGTSEHQRSSASGFPQMNLPSTSASHKDHKILRRSKSLQEREHCCGAATSRLSRRRVLSDSDVPPNQRSSTADIQQSTTAIVSPASSLTEKNICPSISVVGIPVTFISTLTPKIRLRPSIALDIDEDLSLIHI